MEKLIVKKVETLQTSKGGTYKKLDLQKEDGSVVSGVSAFSFKFPALDLLIEGGEILGSIVIDGNYKNLIGTIEKPKANSNYKAQQIEKVMEKKENSIKNFQEDKELGIKMASTLRMAVELAIAEKDDPTVLDTLEQGIEKWRHWLWVNWEKSSKDYPPF